MTNDAADDPSIPHPFDEAMRIARITVGEPRFEPWQAGAWAAAIAFAVVSLFKSSARIDDDKLIAATLFACLVPAGAAYAYFWLRHKEYMNVLNKEYDRLKGRERFEN